MNAAAETLSATSEGHRDSLWLLAVRKLRRDRVGMWAFMVVLAYALIAVGVVFGWWGSHWAGILRYGRRPIFNKTAPASIGSLRSVPPSIPMPLP